MINGRYKTRSGEIVAVHDEVGHLVEVPEGDSTLLVARANSFHCLEYDVSGNCTVSGTRLDRFDLMERLNPQSLLGQMKIEGCDKCKG